MSEGGYGECIVEGCENRSRTKKPGLCNLHDKRRRRYGDPLKGPPILTRLTATEVKTIRDEAEKCSVPGCDKPVQNYVHRLCAAHYKRYWRYGDPLGSGRPKRIEHCSVTGCERPLESLEFCLAHYKRFRRHGDPLGGRIANGTLFSFASAALENDTEDCILWPFSKDRHGYGRMSVAGKDVTVSRWVCERVHGPPPNEDGYDARHKCGNGHLGCITKNHLQWGTRQQNCDDAVAQGRTPRGEGHYNARLAETEVRTIRALRSRQSIVSLASMFDVSAATICDILARRTWAWLPDRPAPPPVANDPDARV